MRIERIRIDGFGALSGVDLAWPEGKLLLVVDPNETGKTTLCEAVLAALYGLPRGRVGGSRARDLRRPRSGAPLRVGLDVRTDGVRWAVDRDLDAGTLRVVDRDRGVEVTRDVMRGSGRDVLGERVTGLTEALFRTTAYCGQNVLDRDELDSTLALELAKIADSGGGEASVVRALRALLEARSKMPDAVTGNVSVETEIVRLAKRLEERQAEVARLGRARAAAEEAGARLSRRTAERDAARRRAAEAEVAALEAERRDLDRRLAARAGAEKARRALEEEAAALSADAGRYTAEVLAEVDRLREARGKRPEALVKDRSSLEADRLLGAEESRDRVHRFGPAAALPPLERVRLGELLGAAIRCVDEIAVAEEALAAQWDELRREGVAEDLARLESLPAADRELLQVAEEERSRLELHGVQCDRRAAEASAGAAIASGERRGRVKRAKGLVTASVLTLATAGYLVLAPRVPRPIVASALAFGICLALLGLAGWVRGSRHGRDEEQRRREEEAAARREAQATRRQLSELRQRLDRMARAAALPDAVALMKAARRARAAHEKKLRLVERETRRAAAIERRVRLEAELEPFRAALGCEVGLPEPDDARRFLAVLADLDRADRTGEIRTAALEREAERLVTESAQLARLDEELRAAFERLGIPRVLPLSEAALIAESGRRRAARYREIVEVELPARRDAVVEPDASGLVRRRDELLAEVARRRTALPPGSGPGSGPPPPAHDTPEAARRAADDARRAAAEAEEARLVVERELALRSREGGERAGSAEEALRETEAALRRAQLFREALDLAQESLAAAASSAYGDFRQGLGAASREILAAWRMPYEQLEFGEDLSVSAVLRGGRAVTRAEVAGALSTGAREQLHLTARLAALRYLGTGERGVPLLLDDPLVGADDERFVAVMSFLATEVLAERPVLVVSCHGWRHRHLLDRLPPEVAARIEPVSLAERGTFGSAPGI